MPTPVEYPGKPADRYWEFEDAKVSFGGIDSGPVNLARMLLVEYALVFGNDWFVVPVEMPVGWTISLAKFRVRDTFGVESWSGRRGNVDGVAWTMWQFDQPQRQPSAPSPSPRFFFLATGVRADVRRVIRSRRSRCSATRWRTWRGASSDAYRVRRARSLTGTRESLRAP